MERILKFTRPKRVVVKIGTTLLTDPQRGVNEEYIASIAGQIARVRRMGIAALLVSSGAIGAGMNIIGMRRRPQRIPIRQALASVGQSRLMHAYERAMGEHGVVVAQVLLTQDDMHDRRRYLNARNTLLTLLDMGVIPVINENDTVATEELKVGDNDTLSALVASAVDADLLIILSDVDGLFTGNPHGDREARLLREVHRITSEIEELAGGSETIYGTGGMVTKIKAAKIATSSGAFCSIANGRLKDVIIDIVEGKLVGTRFYPGTVRIASRKHWIAYNLDSQGRIKVDDGAKAALLDRGKSLLPPGIIQVSGEFFAGDAVDIVDGNDIRFAKGLVNYDASDLRQIMGAKVKDIASILGYKPYDEVIHRDNMVILRD
ncbi:MAG: glutamate 5-kinase [bacterium]